MDSENKYGVLYAQQRLLELGKVFHAFCNNYGIKYSLAYGSLLGAIRHKGFIPWDDDLDVFVDRKTYYKLVSCIENNPILYIERNTESSLWVDRVRLKEDYASKESGNYCPTLDILIIDSVPNNHYLESLKFILILALQGMMKPHLSLSKGSFFLKICSLLTFILGKLFPFKWKSSWYRKVSQIGNNKDYTEVANYNGEYADLKKKYPYSLMNNIILYPFEDTVFYIVKDYDSCLTIQFGDYMTPPEEKDRRPRHGG